MPCVCTNLDDHNDHRLQPEQHQLDSKRDMSLQAGGKSRHLKMFNIKLAGKGVCLEKETRNIGATEITT